MSQTKAWYVRYKYLILAIFLVMVGARVYIMKSKQDLFGERQEVPVEQRERLASAYEEKMRMRLRQSKNPVAPTAGSEQAVVSSQPRLLYFRFEKGRVARFKIPNQLSAAQAFKIADELEGACIAPAQSAKTEPDDKCKRTVQIAPASAQALLGCTAKELQKPGELAPLERMIPDEKHYLLTDAPASFRIESLPSPPVAFAGELYDVLREPCADGVPALPGRIVKIHVLTRGKG